VELYLAAREKTASMMQEADCDSNILRSALRFAGSNERYSIALFFQASLFPTANGAPAA